MPTGQDSSYLFHIGKVGILRVEFTIRGPRREPKREAITQVQSLFIRLWHYRSTLTRITIRITTISSQTMLTTLAPWVVAFDPRSRSRGTYPKSLRASWPRPLESHQSPAPQ